MTSNVVSMCVVPVKIKHNKSRKMLKTYTMLDCCSQGSFINSELAKKLRAEGTMTTIKVRKLNGEESQETEAINGLKVTSLTEKNGWIDLPVSYTRENLLVGDEDIATSDKIKDWEYLKRIADKIIQKKDISIGLLICGNCSKALEPLEVIPSKDGGPVAFRTLLGWCIVGPIGEITSCKTASCDRIPVQDMTSKTVASHYFAMESKVKDAGIKQMLHKMYAADFSDRCASKKGEDITEMSVEERNFMTLMEKECSKEVKHFKLPLPLRDHNEMFPDNRSMAKARLKNLKKKFSRDKQYHEDYTRFMEDTVQKEYAEKSFQQVQQGKIWFIPHHEIYHPSKPGKIRVAFDCSAEYNGVSINKKLMSGPGLTNQIISILVKFREDFVAVMADIETMFYQVFVADQHRNLLSFLWWENGDISEQHQHYHMNVHVFGRTSSSSCSNYAVRRTARDYEQKYGKEVADIEGRVFKIRN